MPEQSKIEQLEKQIQHLTALVEKQNKIILSTGERLMGLEVRHQKKQISKLHGTTNGDDSSSDEEDESYATNSDLIQLVGELEGQLINLDYKSVNRVNNSNIKDDDNLAIIFNADGEEPPSDIAYPKTKNELLKFTDLQLFKLALFYEQVPPVALGKDGSLEKSLSDLSLAEDEEAFLEKHMNSVYPSKKSKDDLFNTVAAYLGVEKRK